MPLRYLDDPGPSLGMIRDQPSWTLPPGALYDSLNLVYDQPGLARLRMGSTGIFSGSQTVISTSLGFCYSDDATTIEELYGHNGKTGHLDSINKTTAVNTNVAASSACTVGRAVNHFGFLSFPLKYLSGTGRNIITVAGQTNGTTYTNTAVAQVTAGNQQVTLTGADVTTANVFVGAVLVITDTTALITYIGRVVSVDTTKLFTVWPTPTWTNAAVPINALAFRAAGPMIAAAGGGGTCAASFQNRLLVGNTNDLGSVSQGLITDRRVYYSPLPTESTAVPGSTQVLTGAAFVQPTLWPRLNYFDVPGAAPIIALEPVAGNQLLILTSTHPVIFSGNLTTQLATTSPTITFDLSDINVNAGCLSDLSVQRTPKGVVWAGPGGIYAWDGREPVDLTTGTISTHWRGLVRGSSFVVHGSAYVRGYYLVSGSSGGATFALMADLTGKVPKWTRASGAGTDIFIGVERPTDRSQVFAARWWDQSAAVGAMTNGQIVHLETMLNPYTAGATTTDADGTAVTLSATTRTITGDPELQKMFQRATVRHQQSSTTAAVTVTAQSKIDAADISAASVRAIGSLSNTSVLTVNSATNANPIVVTTSTNHGLQSDDFVDIDGVTGNTNANGRWRIVVTGNTTFSLVGGIGNGASGGSPTCKKLTETDYLISPLNAGQGVSYKFDGAPNNFELHGTRTAVLQREPVMSS